MRRGLMIVLGLALTASVPQARAADAVAYQIDAAHDGHTSFRSGFSAPLKMLWTRNLEHRVSYPLIVNGMVFVTLDGPKRGQSQLTALSLKTGQTLWQQSVDSGSFPTSILAYDNGKVFVQTFDGFLSAFAADNTGRLLWTVPIATDVDTTPVAANGLVYVSSPHPESVLFAVDEATGKIVWKRASGTVGESEPTLGDGGVYQTYPCSYHKYDPATGNTIWEESFLCEGGGIDFPAYYNKLLYFSGGYPLNGVVLDSNNGKIKGSLSSGITAFWQSSTSTEYRVLTYDDGALISFSPNSGNIFWRFKGNGNFPLPPIVINDLVALALNEGKNGTLLLLDARTGKLVWSQKLGAPVTASAYPYAAMPGLAAGGGVLVVPSTTLLTAFGP